MTETDDPTPGPNDALLAQREARRDELLDILTALGISRREALQVAAESTVSMKPYVREAIALGVMPTQLERITGVSRRAIYDWTGSPRKATRTDDDDAQPDAAAEQP